jgi:FAD/FMN-containing dehydrogenase
MLDKSFLEELEGICTVRQGEALDALHPGFHEGNLRAGVVAFPDSVAAVRAVVRLCGAHDVAIVPHGGRTGLAGAGASSAGQLIVDTSRLNMIEDVDVVSGTVIAGAGATLLSVQKRCAQAGLTPGIDIAARGSATIGGMISTNAGGMEAFRCGVMRHRVLGIEAVLPDGSLFQDMTRVTKVNEGLDIKHMLIGAEGRLGIVTRAVLKLEALPRATATALVACNSAGAAVAAFHQLRARGNLLRAEIMWRLYADTVAQGLGLEGLLAFCDAPLLVLFEVSGEDQAAAREALEAGLMEAIEAGDVLDAVFAQSGRQEADMWRVREESWEVEGRYPNSLWYDVSVPLGQLDGYVGAMLSTVERADAGLKVFVLGHLGDGNLHITVAHADGVKKWKPQADDAVFDGLKQFGGSISAEHGVGLEKMAALQKYGDPGRLAAARAVKQALDPHNLMNPGKVLGG